MEHQENERRVTRRLENPTAKVPGGNKSLNAGRENPTKVTPDIVIANNYEKKTQNNISNINFVRSC